MLFKKYRKEAPRIFTGATEKTIQWVRIALIFVEGDSNNPYIDESYL
jgi:hypothetical protein